MVTEYNRYTIMKRKMEMAGSADKANTAVSPLVKVEESAVIKENLTPETEETVEEKPKKTDAEKLKRGRKKNV